MKRTTFEPSFLKHPSKKDPAFRCYQPSGFAFEVGSGFGERSGRLRPPIWEVERLRETRSQKNALLSPNRIAPDSDSRRLMIRERVWDVLPHCVQTSPLGDANTPFEGPICYSAALFSPKLTTPPRRWIRLKGRVHNDALISSTRSPRHSGAPLKLCRLCYAKS